MTAVACAQAARDAGFAGMSLTIAVAVAGAESTWNPDAHCLNCVPSIIEDSRGAWQVNVLAHPAWAGTNLFDLKVCARAAWEISDHGTNFAPWSTFTDGAWVAYVPAAQAAVATLADVPTGWCCTDPSTGGTWTLDGDGSIWATAGAPYLGAPNQHPDWHLAPIVGITPWHDPVAGWGYVVITRDGTPISPENPDVHRYYYFRRVQQT